MKYCSACGKPVEERIPAGDDRPRHTCPSCGIIYYQNPKIVVGCIVEHDGKVLLCKRAIPPSPERWTLPAGYLELQEGVADGAVRETREEANARVRVSAPHSFLDLPHIGQCYYLFRSRFESVAFSPGPESLEVGLFELGEIPWDDLAFPVIHFALQLYVEDIRLGLARTHLGVLDWRGSGSRFDWRQYDLRDHLALPLQDRSTP